jgi:hypothetical protein
MEDGRRRGRGGAWEELWSCVTWRRGKNEREKKRNESVLITSGSG